MFNLENMNEYEQYSYLTDMCDPYISYEVINGELKKVFKVRFLIPSNYSCI